MTLDSLNLLKHTALKIMHFPQGVRFIFHALSTKNNYLIFLNSIQKVFIVLEAQRVFCEVLS